ncbi:hypothetical protein [Roseovarius sp.]|uniref:hypothetical protein n=1 Tax=Roseovarius sp. TaxID=1486281 RepID=UPI003BAACDFA
MRKHSTEAGKWIAENNLSWGPKKEPHGGEQAKYSGAKAKRVRRAKVLGGRISKFDSIKDFVERNRGHRGDECLFVPAAQPSVPAAVSFCGRNIAAARYMALLTIGTPKSEGMIVRHKCGNGHLSCVNPAHLLWGTPGDNLADANKHRKAGDDVRDRISAID